MKAVEQLLSRGHPPAFPSKELPASITTASRSERADFPDRLGNNSAVNTRAKGKTRIYWDLGFFFCLFLPDFAIC